MKNILKDIEKILKRCREIIITGELAFNDEEALRKHQYEKVFNVLASIEDIYHLFYPNKLPFHLTTTYFNQVMKSCGIYTTNKPPDYFFKLRFENFKAFTEDLEKGIITNFSNFITLNLFDSLLEQAKELRTYNTEPLNRAACVLTRIILEDSLKKLCDNNKISLKTNKASEVNDELKKTFIYPLAQWRSIQGWLDIGNEAAHPTKTFQSISETLIDNILSGVKDFSIKYLS